MLKVIPRFSNNDYIEILKKIFHENDSQENNPRYDLQKTLIFTRDIKIEELRRNLEQLIGIVPIINQHSVDKAIIYVFSYSEISLIQDIPEEIKKIKYKRNALFIRGSTDFYNLSKAELELTEVVDHALKELKHIYNERIKWNFRLAEHYIDTNFILRKHDPVLAALEKTSSLTYHWQF